MYRTRGATVTVVTGPAGVDIGPVAAHLGRDLSDGLAIRTVDSNRAEQPHSSPNPYRTDPAGTELPDTVRLTTLPSAWQHPDTNLGVAWTGYPDTGLVHDIAELDALGLHPGHRVTVQHRSNYRSGAPIPEPVEVGDLAAHARDSVLRAPGGGHVLIEAGDGQTFLDAFHTVGLPPWSAHIDALDLWLVVDAGQPFDELVAAVNALLAVNGGATVTIDAALHLAVTGIHAVVPGLVGCTEVDDGVWGASTPQDWQMLHHFIRGLRERCRVESVLFNTGSTTDPYTFIDLR